MLSFYTAGKIWHAPKFRHLRDEVKLPVNSRWIDLEADSDLVQNHKDKLWEMCLEDVLKASFVLVYAEPEDLQNGALVEIGMAMAANKPIYSIGNCKSFQASGNSDAAFTHHHLWKWLSATNLVKGAFHALGHEIGKLNARRYQSKTA
jgi:nucleoside 2-deoxyribosyltransferase